jgi:hypothetical protein
MDLVMEDQHEPDLDMVSLLKHLFLCNLALKCMFNLMP